MEKKMLPPSYKVFKNVSSEKKTNPLKNLIQNPIGHFALMGVILIVLGMLAQQKIISYSLSTTLATVVIYAIIAIGFCLLLGYSGLASLGTAGFAGVGALSAFLMMQKFPVVFGFYLSGQVVVVNLSFFTSLLVAILVAIVIGLFVGFISLRIEGMYLAILTLGLAEILFQLFKNIDSSFKIDLGNIVFLTEKMSNSTKCTIVSIIFVILLIITNNLINSPTGRAMLAMKNSTSAAQAMGISLLKYRLLAFVISTIYASIGGMLYLIVTRSLPTSGSTFLALSMSLNILGAVIVGGSRSLWGTTIGAVLIYGIQTLFLDKIEFFNKNPGFMGIVSGILLIVIVMFYPGGLAQLFFEIKNKIKVLIKKIKERKYGAY